MNDMRFTNKQYSCMALCRSLSPPWRVSPSAASQQMKCGKALAELFMERGEPNGVPLASDDVTAKSEPKRECTFWARLLIRCTAVYVFAHTSTTDSPRDLKLVSNWRAWRALSSGVPPTPLTRATGEQHASDRRRDNRSCPIRRGRWRKNVTFLL